MKIRPLPEIDLARIAPLSRDRQRMQLQQILNGWPPFSYGPLRRCLPDILNVQPRMFGPTELTAWPIIEARIRRPHRSDEETEANLRVARGLYQFSEGEKIRGRPQEFFALPMSIGRSVTYWLPVVLAINSMAHAVFIDPRRTRGLTRQGRAFVFSMMHERIRAADPDFSNVKLAIFQFGDLIQNRRDVFLSTDDGVDLFSLDEMEAMVRTTYELWQEVCESDERESRRKAAGKRGPLL